ncbi:MAG: hypothetical protein ACRDS0_29465 [Pseudonocardiaceae bacterium]
MRVIREVEVLSVDFVDGGVVTRLRGRTDEDGWRVYEIPGTVEAAGDPRE